MPSVTVGQQIEEQTEVCPSCGVLPLIGDSGPYIYFQCLSCDKHGGSEPVLKHATAPEGEGWEKGRDMAKLAAMEAWNLMVRNYRDFIVSGRRFGIPRSLWLARLLHLLSLLLLALLGHLMGLGALYLAGRYCAAYVALPILVVAVALLFGLMIVLFMLFLCALDTLRRKWRRWRKTRYAQ